MSVQVFTSHSNGTAPYQAGTKILIKDGHLLVLDSNEGIVAIYSPGQWHHAEVARN
jgi:hypothetical protein